MPSQKISVDFKGLKTDSGEATRDPSALIEAVNVDLRRPGIVEQRDGFVPQTDGYAVNAGIWSIFSSEGLGDDLLLNVNGASHARRLFYGDGSAALTQLFDIDGASDVEPFQLSGLERLDIEQAGANHYLSTARGTARLESDFKSTDTFYYAGMPRPCGFSQETVSVANFGLVNATTLVPAYPASANWLPAGSSVAYRAVWVTKDADGTELVSAPSGRWVIDCIGVTAKAVVLRVLLPLQCNSNTEQIVNTGVRAWKLRIYRSLASTGTPSDELQQCGEVIPSNTDIVNGYLEFIDVAPEAALGAYLYTNTVSGGDLNTSSVISSTNGVGVLAANDRPPRCTSIAYFRDCAFYVGLQGPQRLTFSILAVGTTGDVLQAGDEITVNGTVYTAIAPGTPAADEFCVYTAGTAEENLRATAVSLVESINRNYYGGSGLIATYQGSSLTIGSIGRIMIEAVRDDLGAFQVEVTSGSGLPYSPQLADPFESTAETQPNGVAISKPFQYDAVPPANYIKVGRSNSVIMKVIAAADALYFFTTDGLYWLRGLTPSDFYVTDFDVTVKPVARECITALDEAIYAVTTRGFVRVTSNGVESIDFGDVQIAITQFISTLSRFPDSQSNWFAVADPQRMQILFGVTRTTTPGIETFWVYNIQTRRWCTYAFPTDWPVIPSCGVVRWNDETLFIGQWRGATTTSALFTRQDGEIEDISWNEGTEALVAGLLTWTAQLPNPGMLCEWEELQLHFNSTAPVEFEVTLTTEEASQVISFLGTPNSRSVRVIVPPSVRLSRSMTVTFQGLQDQYELTSMTFFYSPVSEVTMR